MISPPAPVDAVGCDLFIAAVSELRPGHFRLLDATERRRRQQYLRSADSDRFVVGAVLLRAAVARELGARPEEVVVDRTCNRCGEPHGRPRLPGMPLEVSVSHSGHLAVVAVTRAGAVGVDVEQIKPLDTRALVPRVCTKEEQRFARELRGFYTYWVRKEAFLKATGEGLLRPLLDVAVSPPESSPEVLHVAGHAPPPIRLVDLDLDGYAGAVAALNGRALRVTTHEASGLLTEAATSSR